MRARKGESERKRQEEKGACSLLTVKNCEG